MKKFVFKVFLQAVVITALGAVIAIGTNAIRPDGIPLIADVEYEIFAPCRDSEIESEEINVDSFSLKEKLKVLYVDARPKAAFAKEHVEGSINIPYSVLFGATEEDIEEIKKAVANNKAQTVIVYGVYADSLTDDAPVDFAKPLAQQLLEAKIVGVKHLEGGLTKLKESGVKIVVDLNNTQEVIK